MSVLRISKKFIILFVIVKVKLKIYKAFKSSSARYIDKTERTKVQG